MIEPTAPFRVDLATFFTTEGDPDAAAMSYSCGCRRVLPASSFVDVRDQPDLFDRPFVCLTCASDLQRAEAAAYEAALVEYQAGYGYLPAERLNDVRAQRDQMLQLSDWAELPSAVLRVGQPKVDDWMAYRTAVWAWFTTARDTGAVGPLPDKPE